MNFGSTQKTRNKIWMRTDVFDRRGADAFSRRAFMALIGGLVLYGLTLNAAIASYTAKIPGELTWMHLVLLGLVLPITGIFLAKTRSIALGFLGYNLILVPFGILIGPLVSAQVKTNGPEMVIHTLCLTGCTTAIMALVGCTYPKVFSRLGGVLLVALISLLVARILQIFVPSMANMSWIDWVAAGIFSLFIGLDCHRATTVPATALNALHISVSLYLDILNLFLTILRINKD